MICVTDKPLSPEHIVAQASTLDSGCVATYVGLIRDNSRGKTVQTVEYADPDGAAEAGLQQIVDEIKQQWLVNEVVIHHRIGKLAVGDINLVVAVAAGHRVEGFAACQYAIDRFKEKLPTSKVETYTDGSAFTGD